MLSVIGILNYLLLYDGTVPFPIHFSVGSGVRQGSSLSPTLFNLYINAIIVSLKSSDYGCQARGKFFGCFLYADDIIIMSPSLHGLQSMLAFALVYVIDWVLKSITLNHIVLFLVTAAKETLKTCTLAMTASTVWSRSSTWECIIVGGKSCNLTYRHLGAHSMRPLRISAAIQRH